MNKVILTLALIPSLATAATPACTAYSNQIDSIQRLMARNHAEGIGDSSAARESNRLLTENNLLLKENMILQLMTQAKCPLPAEVDYSAKYITNASACSIAMLKPQDPSKFVLPAECDLSKWPDQRR